MIRVVNTNVIARAVGGRPAYSVARLLFLWRHVGEIGLEGLFLRMMCEEVNKAC